MDDLITTAELAQMLRVAPEALRYWRWRGQGSRSLRVGRKVVYRRDAVVAWLEAQGAATGRGGSAA
jgi:DNA-binding transcriptional MerR regulator